MLFHRKRRSPCEVIEALPLSEFGMEIHVILVGEQLVKFLFIGSVGALDLAIELR